MKLLALIILPLTLSGCLVESLAGNFIVGTLSGALATQIVQEIPQDKTDTEQPPDSE